MKSDLSAKNTQDDAPSKMAASEILRHEVHEGLDAIRRPTSTLFVSALSGGLDVGFSVFLMAVVQTIAKDKLPEPIVTLLVANMYSVGFIFVVVGRSELFTEQTSLAVLPLLRGKATLPSVARLWVVVYLANILGAVAFALIISYVAPALHVASPESFGVIGHRLIDHGGHVILLSAILAGWLMGLLSWMVSAARDTISQIVIVWMVTAAIGLGGLHHVVLGTVEVLAAMFAHQGVTFGDFFRFLFWATVGNAFGGSVFVALIKFGHARPVPN